MATKKKAAVKSAPKKSVKPAPKKPVKKAAPKKTAPKPAAKKAASKTAPKKAAAKKPAAKPVAKKAPAKPVAKKAANKTVNKKPAAKPAAKKALVKPVVKKAAVKAAPKKPAAKPAAKAPVVKPVAKSAAKPVSAVPAKPAAKPSAAPAPSPLGRRSEPNKIKEVVLKPVVKQAIQQLKKDEKSKKPAQLKPIKTSVSTSVKYQPDFTKSILDSKQEAYQPGSPLVRYSDAELQEFKELIQRKLEAAKKELAYLQGLITRKDEMGGGESEGRYMTMEDGTISMEREQLAQMASRQVTYIDHLEKALMRIENKTYGICRVTGKLIEKARLRAVPHATLSIEAKMGLVKGPQQSGE